MITYFRQTLHYTSHYYIGHQLLKTRDANQQKAVNMATARRIGYWLSIVDWL